MSAVKNREPDSHVKNHKENKVTAVIVTYQPDIGVLQENIELTCSQVSSLVIVDNGSVNQNEIFDVIEQLQSSFSNLSLICLKENKGLGFAHNRGISRAKEFSSDYVLLMDQDSQPHSDMVEKLHAATLQLMQKKNNGNSPIKLAAVGPRYTSRDRGDSFFVRFGWLKFKRSYCLDSEEGIIPADFLISSGSLILMKALDEIGLMDEDLFIDHVDTEWFLRAKHSGYQSFGVCSARMQHGLGELTRTVKLFGLGRERNVPQHKPFRYYYMFRNSIQLYKRGYSKLWIWNDLQRLLQIFVFYGLCYGPRLQNIAMMLRGVKDGLTGRSGKLL